MRRTRFKVVEKKTGYAKTRISYYDNSCATFNREYLVICGDTNPNSGPNQSKCLVCHRGLANNHRQVQCI